MSGNSMAANTAMMLTTTSSSKSVNPWRSREEMHSFMTDSLKCPSLPKSEMRRVEGKRDFGFQASKVDEVNVDGLPPAVKKNRGRREHEFHSIDPRAYSQCRPHPVV